MILKKRIFIGMFLLLMLVMTGCAKQAVSPAKPYPDGTIYDENGRPLWVPPSKQPPAADTKAPETAPDRPNLSAPDTPSIPAELPSRRIGAPADTETVKNDQMLLAASTPLTEEAEELLAKGELDRALAVAERAVRINPGDPRLWNLMARIQIERGDAVQAEHLARKSNSLARSDRTLTAENWMLIAAALKRQGREAEAEKALQQADQAERGER